MFDMLCVDNFGDGIYLCHHTNNIVHADDAVIVGAIVPSVNAKYVVLRGIGELAHKQSAQWFHESEANCNTCKHLVRVVHKKSKDGFLYGKCNSKTQDIELHQYRGEWVGDIMKFHPHDPMHMSCYDSRFYKLSVRQ